MALPATVWQPTSGNGEMSNLGGQFLATLSGIAIVTILNGSAQTYSDPMVKYSDSDVAYNGNGGESQNIITKLSTHSRLPVTIWEES